MGCATHSTSRWCRFTCSNFSYFPYFCDIVPSSGGNTYGWWDENPNQARCIGAGTFPCCSSTHPAKWNCKARVMPTFLGFKRNPAQGKLCGPKNAPATACKWVILSNFCWRWSYGRHFTYTSSENVYSTKCWSWAQIARLDLIFHPQRLLILLRYWRECCPQRGAQGWTLSDATLRFSYDLSW